MPSKEERRKALEAQMAELDSEPDEPEFEVEWWEEDKDGNRRGGRLPWSKGKAIYGKYAPDLFGEKPPEEEAEEGKDEAPGKVQRFGRRVG